MHLADQIDEKTYKTKKLDLQKEKHDIEEKLGETSHASSSHRQTIETALDFANAAKEKFTNGTRDDKREILFAIGSNLTLTNKKVRIELLNHFQILADHEYWEKKYNGKFKPQKYTEILSKNPDLAPANPIWLPR